MSCDSSMSETMARGSMLAAPPSGTERPFLSLPLMVFLSVGGDCRQNKAIAEPGRASRSISTQAVVVPRSARDDQRPAHVLVDRAEVRVRSGALRSSEC